MPRRKVIHPQSSRKSSVEGPGDPPVSRPSLPPLTEGRATRAAIATTSCTTAATTTTTTTPTRTGLASLVSYKGRSVTMASRSIAATTGTTDKLATTPTQGRKPLVRQTRSVSRGKPGQSPSAVSMSKETTPTKDSPAKSGKEDDLKSAPETGGGGAGDGVQRNLSLEALFQVTHSELKNIHRSEDDPVSYAEESKSGVQQKGRGDGEGAPLVIVKEISPEGDNVRVSPAPMQTQLVEASPSLLTTAEVVLNPEADGTLIVDGTHRIYVEVPQSPPEATVEVEMMGDGDMGSAGYEGKPPQSVVKLPVSERGIEKYQLKSDSLEKQGLKLTYTKKTYDQYEPNPISYGTYKPRSYKATHHVLDPVLQESGSIQVGPKRKHPAKPGRHICQYCGRGCAKPSVLQKHIRAHTGERPYPCIPCGFSFKTKSNLYKHCKSRAHAIKAGLNPSVDDASKDSNKSRDESFCEEELGESDDMGEGEGLEEGGTSDSSMRDLSSRSTSVETGENSQPGGSSFESNQSLHKDEVMIQNSESGDIVLTLDVGPHRGEEERDKAHGSPKTMRPTRVYKTDKEFYDVYVNKNEQRNKTSSPEPSGARGKIVMNAPRKQATSLDGLAITSTVHKEADNSMKVTIKYPKVTKQHAVTGNSMDMHYLTVDKPDAPGSNFHRSASLPDHPQHRQASLTLSQSPRDTKTVTAEALREKLQQLQQRGSPIQKGNSMDSKSFTKEMVGERINQLISDNAAVLALPMADAPRPKRVSRQNSEVKDAVPSGPQRGVLSSSLSLDSAANRALYKGHGRAKSMEVKVMDSGAKNVNLLPGQDQVLFLSQAEPTDQPPGKTDLESQSKLAELVAAAKTATPVPAVSPSTSVSTPLPQEFKIEFKLAKAATTDASAVSTPRLPTASTPVMVQNVQQLIAQPSVVLPPQPGMLTRQLSLPITQQQGGAQSSIIRDLLLKGQDEQCNVIATADQAGATQQAPTFQMVEFRPDGTTSVINDLTQVVVLDSKGTPTTAYMAPTTQDPVPMNVAHDVEVVASGTIPFQRTTQLKRTMSLPQGIPTASGSSSPYGNVIFDNYNPNVPPRRGRPKGSKNRVREQLSLNIPSSSGSMTPEIYTSSMKLPLISSSVTSQVVIGSPVVTPSRPPLKLTIPPPGGSLSSQGTGSTLSTGTPLASGSILTPNPDTPNTPSLTKLKLKGKLLMKRSMSVERMLSQERDKAGSMDESLPLTPLQGISSPAIYSRPGSSGSTLTPLSYITSPLVRTASADEVSPLKKRRAAFQQARSEDSSIRRLLGHQSTDSSFQSFSASTETPLIDASGVPLATPVIMASSTSKPGLISTPSQDIPDRVESGKRTTPALVRQNSVSTAVRPPTKLSPLAMAVPSTPTIVISRGTAPTNQYQPVMVQDLPFMAPYLKLGRQDALSLPQSVYLSLKLTPTASSILSKASSSEKDVTAVTMSTKTTPTLSVQPSLTRTDSVEVAKQGNDAVEPMEVETEEDVIVLPRSKVDLTKALSTHSSGGSIDSTCSVSPTKPLSEKAMSQVLLMGHQCPMLRMHTHATFCTLAKPQPMYVPQETSKKLSMYSNWQSARYNPNPMGLTSRELMSLYHLRQHENDPYFTSPTMGPSKTGVLTHSSYWNYYNKMRSLNKSEDYTKAEDEVRTIKQVPEVKMATGVKIAEEQDKLIQVTAPTIAMETTVITTPATPRQKQREPKRLKIFAGGYKTNEEYVYIRGRGRGKYVCEECGIRCKKPSMLRKHIRTHTDVRPYLCQHCTFSFKTKGNLTKHMKSKAHQKKCTELGIIPVPVTVEESQIDPEALALQAQMARDGRTPSEDDEAMDEDEEDDGEEEEMEEEDDEEAVLLVDAATGETRETIRYRVVQENPDGPQYVAIQDGNSAQPTLVKIESTAQAAIMQHIKQSGRLNISSESVEGDPGVLGQDDWDNDQPRPSIDKEIAHSLLDLSKGNEPKKSSKGAISLETRRLLRQHSAHAAEEGKKEMERKEKEDADAKNDGTRLDTLIGALISRTKGPNEGGEEDATSVSEVGRISAPSRVRMATSIYQGSTAKSSQIQATSSDLQHIHKRSHNTYAQKIAALQSANENDLKMTMERSKTQPTGSGFVPPVFRTEDRTDTPTTSNTRPNKTLLRRQTSVGGLGDDKPLEPPQEESPMNLSVDKDADAGSEAVNQTGVVPTTVSSYVETSKGQQAVETNTQQESLPTPGKSIEAPAIYKDGKYMCPICDKMFAEYSQYAYHKNIHYIERPFRCEECSLSFRTPAALQKHMRSEVHQNKQNVNQQFGVTKDNPRPFKCEECDIAFRIHGHLMKHIRSKSHIQALARLGKSVPETITVSADSDSEIVEEESMEVEEEETDVSAKVSNITNALKDPDNILRPRESTPPPRGVPSSSQPGSSGQKDAAAAGQGTPESDQFHYHKLSDYEKDFNASNENVTVEKIKMELDIGTISSFGTQTEVETERFAEKEGDAADKAARNREVFRHQASTGSTEQHPHKCGICGRTFKAITTLKQHLVTHAELRPYVCEYCDAGFTTAQSLKFHLRTHTQERPYICGQCGDTFARSDHLRNHMHSHEEDGDVFPPQPQAPSSKAPPVSASPPVKTTATVVQSHPVPVVASVSAVPSQSQHTVYQTIKPKPTQIKMLRPAQGQLIRSSSADPHILRDIQPRANELPGNVQGLTVVRDTAAARRLAFTSSLSLPIHSGAVQLVSMMPDSPQLVPQPLGVVRMPLLSMPVPNSTGFAGQLQTVLTPTSSNMQTLFFSGSPMMLSSMPIIQQVQAAPMQSSSSSVVTTPTITITTPTKVTVNAEDHEGVMRENPAAPPDPVLIPTVVLEKEEEDDLDKSQLQDSVEQTAEVVKFETGADGLSTKYEPGEIPECVLEENESNLVIEEHHQYEHVEHDGRSGVPPEVISDAALSDTIRQNASSPLGEGCLPCDGSDAAAGSAPSLQPEPASNSGATHQDAGSRMLATKLIPGDDLAQNELVHLIEQQGLSLDKVQVLQVKDSEESTQFVIIESDDNDKVDAHAIAELVNQHKRSKASPPSAASEGHSEMEFSNPEEKIEAGQSVIEQVKQSNGEGQVEEVQQPLASTTSPPARCLKEPLNARQRGMLKRQHSIDLSDQSTNSAKHSEQVSEPAIKVHVTENSAGDCIPRPISAANSQ